MLTLLSSLVSRNTIAGCPTTGNACTPPPALATGGVLKTIGTQAAQTHRPKIYTPVRIQNIGVRSHALTYTELRSCETASSQLNQFDMLNWTGPGLAREKQARADFQYAF